VNDWQTYLADLSRIWPEITLSATVLVALVCDLLLGGRDTRFTGYVTLFGAALSVYFVAQDLAAHGGGAGQSVFGLMWVDGFALYFKLLLGLGLVCVVLLSIFFRGFQRDGVGEYYSVLSAAALGGFFLVSTTNLLMMFLALQLLSISSYVLAGFMKRERRSSEAAMKYLVYGALSAGAMLYGFSLLYGHCGSLELSELGKAFARNIGPEGETLGLPALSVVVAMVLVIAGFGYKIAAAPFHFWSPDVYEGAPTPVTTFLAVVSKAASFGMVVRFFSAFDQDLGTVHLSQILAALAAVSMTFGNLGAMLQDNMKRLLAYSSIAHSGYLLMGVAAMVTPAGAKGATFGGLMMSGGQAVSFYLAAYLLMNLGAFAVVVYISNRYGIESVDRYAGLGWKAPVAGAMMVIFCASLTGLPPTFGFIGKWALFNAVLEKGLYWLAVVAGINTVISLFYYFRIVKALFFRGEEEAFPSPRAGVPVLGLMTLLVVLGALNLYYGIWFPQVAELISRLTI